MIELGVKIIQPVELVEIVQEQGMCIEYAPPNSVAYFVIFVVVRDAQSGRARVVAAEFIVKVACRELLKNF